MELVFLDTTAEGRILKTTGGRFLEVLGASKDGQWFYYAIESDGNTVEIVREHMIDGNEEILTELSIDNVAGVNMTKDYSTFLITVDEGKSDIWMIEDFDPEVE